MEHSNALRHTTLRIPEALYAQLQQTAAEEQRTVAQVIRRILAAHYEDNRN